MWEWNPKHAGKKYRFLGSVDRALVEGGVALTKQWVNTKNQEQTASQ